MEMSQEEAASGTAGAGALDEPHVGYRRREVDVAREAFQSLDGSKDVILDRIRGLRSELEDSLRARLQTEADLKDANRRLADSNERIRELEEEMESLKDELETAKTMLDEIDRSLL
jgi:chromosome segregation ATPase